jgi:2-polyprenyl-3-methyl-5-hydroxy-6-metoxy-1,4-benzoquinol methylase
MSYSPNQRFSGNTYGPKFEACVACGSSSIARWATKSFAYTQGNDAQPFEIDRCHSCGTGFLNPPPSSDYLSAIYAFSGHGLTAPVTLESVLADEREFPNATLDAERLVRIGGEFSRAETRASLDVGSGMGFITREMRRQGWDPVSINPGEFENEVFEAMNGYRPFIGMLGDYLPDHKFGLIALSQVLEHMVRPQSEIHRLSKMLAPGGVLALAVPNFSSAVVALPGTRENGCLWAPEHVNYFTVEGMRRLVRNANLEVCDEAQVTRVRYNAISRRVPFAQGLMRAFVKYGQRPIGAMVNRLGKGLYLNVYARKPS